MPRKFGPVKRSASVQRSAGREPAPYKDWVEEPTAAPRPAGLYDGTTTAREAVVAAQTATRLYYRALDNVAGHVVHMGRGAPVRTMLVQVLSDVFGITEAGVEKDLDARQRQEVGDHGKRRT